VTSVDGVVVEVVAAALQGRKNIVSDIVRASIHVVHPSGNARSQKSITLPPPDDDRSARTYSLASHPVFVSHSRTLHKPPRYPFNLHRTVCRTTTLATTPNTHTHTYTQ